MPGANTLSSSSCLRSRSNSARSIFTFSTSFSRVASRQACRLSMQLCSCEQNEINGAQNTPALQQKGAPPPLNNSQDQDEIAGKHNNDAGTDEPANPSGCVGA
jgi:hypothetical protein